MSLQVSIVIPIYNSEKYLRECLDSLALQDHGSVEFIMVDDGSTDGSVAIAEGYLDDNRFILYKKENGGASSARNYGIIRSSGNYIGFVDSDDIVHPKMVSTLYSLAIKENADIVGSGKINFTNNCVLNGIDEGYFIQGKLLFLKNGFSCCARLFRRELFFNPTVLFPEGVWAEDNGYVPYLAYRANRIVQSRAVLYCYRNTGSGSASSSSRCFRDYPRSMIYLSEICGDDDIFIYSAVISMNVAILRVKHGGLDRGKAIRQYLNTDHGKEIFTQIGSRIKISHINMFHGMMKLYFLGIYFISRGYVGVGLSVYHMNTLKKLLGARRIV